MLIFGGVLSPWLSGSSFPSVWTCTAWTAVIGAATLGAIVFSLSSQAHAYRVMHVRQRIILTHLILWERHPKRLVLTPDEPGYLHGNASIPARAAAQDLLGQSIANGLYIPPVSAQDPLPLKPHSGSPRWGSRMNRLRRETEST